MKFKPGDKVKRISFRGGFCHFMKEDGPTTVKSVIDGNLISIDSEGNGCRYGHPADQYELIKEKTMENLQVGDILLNQNDTECEVFAVLGKVVIVNDGDDDKYTATYIIEELINDGWQVKGTEPEVKEVTLEEIAEKMNIPVSQLRIKD